MQCNNSTFTLRHQRAMAHDNPVARRSTLDAGPPSCTVSLLYMCVRPQDMDTDQGPSTLLRTKSSRGGWLRPRTRGPLGACRHDSRSSSVHWPWTRSPGESSARHRTVTYGLSVLSASATFCRHVLPPPRGVFAACRLPPHLAPG